MSKQVWNVGQNVTWDCDGVAKQVVIKMVCKTFCIVEYTNSITGVLATRLAKNDDLFTAKLRIRHEEME